jgi:hypothetical protein
MLSSRVANYTDIPTYTVPITSPTVHIAIHAANFVFCSAPKKVGIEMDASKNDLSAAGTGKAETSKPSTSQLANTTDLDAQAAAVESNPIYASGTQGSPDVASKPPEIIEGFVPRECQASATGGTHNSLENTVNHLDYEKLMQIQIYNISLAAKLRQNLREALAAHQAREIFIKEKQTTLRSLLCTAIAKEHDHMANSKELYDCFYREMSEACQQNGDAKLATQIRAAKHLKPLADLSKKASLERANIDKHRDQIQALDSIRANSRNIYCKAVHDVLMTALGGEATESYADAKKEVVATTSDPAKTHTVSETTTSTASASSRNLSSRKHTQDESAVTPLKNVQQTTQQPVFERRPETEHQSIREVLDSVNTTEQPVEDTKIEEKGKSKSKKRKEKRSAARRMLNSIEDKAAQK